MQLLENGTEALVEVLLEKNLRFDGYWSKMV